MSQCSRCMKRMAPQVGLESALKRKFNNIQDHGWHLSTWRAVEDRKTDRKWIAEQLRSSRPSLGESHLHRLGSVAEIHGRKPTPDPHPLTDRQMADSPPVPLNLEYR